VGRLDRIDQDTQEAVRRFLSLIAPRYDMAGAIIFGSRARGTHRPDSDADVAVLLRGEHRKALSTTLDMADAAYDILLDTGINISPLPVWLDQWERPESYSNPALLRNIAREGVRL
jgi:predicted nucleotidyltransferase